MATTGARCRSRDGRRHHQGSRWRSTPSCSSCSSTSEWSTTKRKAITRKEWRERLAELRPIWAEEDRKFGEIVARREQRLREWDEYVARHRARLRRLTFGLLGR